MYPAFTSTPWLATTGDGGRASATEAKTQGRQSADSK